MICNISLSESIGCTSTCSLPADVKPGVGSVPMCLSHLTSFDAVAGSCYVLVNVRLCGPWPIGGQEGCRYLTQLLAPRMEKGSRIVFTTSPSETQTPDIDFDNLA